MNWCDEVLGSLVCLGDSQTLWLSGTSLCYRLEPQVKVRQSTNAGARVYAQTAGRRYSFLIGIAALMLAPP